ncbi:non-ribosomal peptide synthetase [Variovorax sp. J22R115]|uniref:non-ribosomal peptide synthetase n=1 Tax=Variovorax sp. J22R115 TaxID=3053509 RepID=UPI002578F3FD|nr:non-ribosomal peptide synthetase [Variovorax sp. J22R115]MDM0053944.1 amino acid adenylation domain-containing protein [Variovorax sp. J22R115]
MKPLDTFIADLRERGVRLWVDPEVPDKVKLRAPEGVLTPALRDALGQRKAELLALLRPEPATAIVPLPPQDSYALSAAQRRLWVLAQFPESAAAYHIPLHQRLDGPLDRRALQRALERLVARHDALRTTFTLVDGEPRQVVHAHLAMTLGFQRLGDRAGANERIRQLGRDQVDTPFDLASGPLLRACLLELAAGRHVLLFTIHHIVADGVSLGVLARDLSRLYASERDGRADGLPALEFGYPAFAAWQNRLHADASMAAPRRHWHECLAGELPLLDLPADRPRPARPSHRGRELSFTLAPGRLDALQAYCRSRNASLFMGLHAALKALLGRYSGQDDIILGTVVAGRDHPGLADQVGCYLNTLALRSRVRADVGFDDFFAEIAEQTRHAFDHQAYPFDRLVGELNVGRDPSRSPLFDVMLVLQSQDEPGLALAGLNVEAAFEHPETSKFDLTFCFKALPGGLVLAIEYATDLYDEPRIRRMGGHFLQLIDSILADPRTPLGRLNLLGESERRQLLDEFNRTASPFPRERTIVELFETTARAASEATALVCGERSMTYGELDLQSSWLARRLQHLGAAPGDLVGLHVPRSLDLVVGLLGILKAGAAYVPLDPAFPSERLGYIVEDAGVRLLVVRGGRPELAQAGTLAWLDMDGEDAVPGADSSAPPLRGGRPESLAYVIYTSGSTGRPKGVEITHRSLVNCLIAMAQRPGLAADDTLLAVTTVSFDIATLELLLPLLCGARVVLATEDEAADGARLAALLRSSGATVMQATPATWQMLLAAGWQGEPRLKILCGGEALPGRLGAQLLARSASVWNMYGPTETTIWSTCRRLESRVSQPLAEAVEPIGRPIANTELYVLDALLQPVPLGLPGDLYIGGEGLAAGYHGRPGLTAERFIASPFCADPARRLYRAGDRARWRDDGELEYLGRSDQQVKLRGFRIELGEIEAVLAEHPAIRQAVVDARADAAGDPALVAWYVGRDERDAQAIPAAALRDHLQRRLPGYMIPAAFARVAALPMTPNGKIDRRALPSPDRRADPAAGDAPPRSEWECRLARLWQQVLAVPEVGVHTDFFALGGHSLKAAALAARVQQETGVALTLVDVFHHPTIAALAARCEASGSALAQPHLPALGPPAAAGDEVAHAQRRLWIVDQMLDGSGAYNLPAALWLDGELDVAALSATLHEAVRRHEALRTTFRAVDGEPRQFVHDASEWPWGEIWHEIDLGGDPDREPTARRIAIEHAAWRFDLARGPLLRATLVHLTPQRHLLLFNVHHIVADLASLGVLVGEMSAGYDACVAARLPSLAPSAVQYRHFAVWQNRRLAGDEAAAHRAYWLSKLAPPPEPLDLPADSARPALKTYAGRVWRTRIDAAMAQRVGACALRHAMTPFMVLTAALEVLLHRYTGAEDIVVGFPLAGRDHPELVGQIGFFVNTVALRVRLKADEDFASLLGRVRHTMLEAYEHQAYPFDRLVEELDLPRDMSRSPLFDVSVSLAHAQAQALRLGELEVSVCDDGFAAAKLDLSFDFHETGDAFELAVTCASDLFGEARIRRMVGHYLRLLDAGIARPETPIGLLPLMSSEEAHQLRVDFNRTERPFGSEENVLAMFRRHAGAAPDAPAVRFGGREWTYAQLARDVERIAALLAAHGVTTGTHVGLYMAPSGDVPAGLLGILAAGGVYVPLDAANPPSRLQAMLEDAGVTLVLTQSALLGRLAGCHMLPCDAPTPVGPPAPPAPPGPHAYVIFTSGSTGRAKAALLPHRGLLNIALELGRLFAPARGDRVLQFAALGFDASVLEIVMALCHGATLCLAARDDLLPGPALLATLEREGISMVLFPPTALAALPDAALPSLRLITVGGEPCPAEVVRRWAPGRTFYNLYGPTEVTIFASAARCSADQGAPTIGRPIGNTRIHLLDRQLQPVPLGVPGELCIAGVGLAEGYLGQPELTAARFVPDPFDTRPGARLYRSGDAARWLPDGSIEFVGRIDQQVKLRGYRIEPGEIEAVLNGHPQVREAIVVVRDDAPSRRYLVAFATPWDPSAVADPRALREFIRERLPDYMVPARIVMVEHMPMTPNLKVDRRALVAVDDGRRAADAEFATPRDDLERALAGFFADVLHIGLDRIGADDNFFELGGDSLLATRIVSRVRDTFRSDVTIPQLFRAGNVRGLAGAVRASLPDGHADAVASALRRLHAMSPAEKQALIESRAGQRASATASRP